MPCGVCGKSIEKGGHWKCGGCGEHLHIECAGLAQWDEHLPNHWLFFPITSVDDPTEMCNWETVEPLVTY